MPGEEETGKEEERMEDEHNQILELVFSTLLKVSGINKVDLALE